MQLTRDVQVQGRAAPCGDGHAGGAAAAHARGKPGSCDQHLNSVTFVRQASEGGRRHDEIKKREQQDEVKQL